VNVLVDIDAFVMTAPENVGLTQTDVPSKVTPWRLADLIKPPYH
jgi:hypothetical protein